MNTYTKYSSSSIIFPNTTPNNNFKKRIKEILLESKKILKIVSIQVYSFFSYFLFYNIQFF